MAQMNKIKGVIAMAGLLGGLALAGVPAFAQTTPPAQGGGMMNGQSGMMQGMPNGQTGMPMNPEMMQKMSAMMEKMSKMMDNCNGMMEKMQKKADGNTPPVPNNRG